jgi:hypothetical protein
MHLRDMQMDLESRQARTEHERQMGELELEAARAELEKARSGPEGGPLALLLVLCGVVRILVATWIYQDIRQRNAGSGLWIVLGLLGGLFAGLVYAVVRLGDSDEGKKRANSR